MNANEEERLAKLLKKSLPPVGAANDTEDSAQLGRDLWPAMLQRLHQPAAPVAWFERVWFDCALLASVVIWLAFFPGVIPVLLYHL